MRPLLRALSDEVLLSDLPLPYPTLPLTLTPNLDSFVVVVVVVVLGG